MHFSSYNASEAAGSVKDDTHRPDLTVDIHEDDKDERGSKPKKARVPKEENWREILKSSTGRDKTFKLIQYALRVYLLFHGNVKRIYAVKRLNFTITWEDALLRRLGSTISGLSMTRKCLLLFNWLGPLTVILAQQSVPYSAESTKPSLKLKSRPLLHTFLHTSPPVLLELVHTVADDIYTFSLLGLFGPRTGQRASTFSDWCWFASTLVNLVENAVERGVMKDLQNQVEGRAYTESMTLGASSKSNPQKTKIDETELKRLEEQDYWLRMTRNKLLMDLVFVSYDCFGIKRLKAPMQTFTGLASGIISTSKLYSREQTILAKAIKN